MSKTKNSIEKGNIGYTGRAFHQDAMEAMRGDIVKGLIELITNCDDAYAGLPEVKQGKIAVEVEHRRAQPWRVVVRDRATGMTASKMRERLANLGQRTSGFEAGENRRGNLGRGAKDLAAFGTVEFESICDGGYSKLVVTKDGEFTLGPKDGKATEEVRKRLGVTKNGTVVTVIVDQGIRCPQHEPLFRKLGSHFQLRDILSDPERKLELVNLNDDERKLVTYTYPPSDRVFDGQLNIPGYPEAVAHLSISRLKTRSEDGPEDASRFNGILIKGRRAIYDNTLFKYESDVHGGWFTGVLRCDYIDKLAREYDDRLVAKQQPDFANPMPIISRRRDGLNPQHPFVVAMRKAAEGPLGELIAEEAERSKKSIQTLESAETRAALNRLARELTRLVSEELREIEVEDLPPGEDGAEPPLLAIVPEEVITYMGEARTVTIAARRAGLNPGDEVQLELDPGGVVELASSVVTLKPHRTREDVLVAQVKLLPLIVNEATMLSASIGQRWASAIVSVEPERRIEEKPVVPPETLQFERPSYRIGWQRQKDLVLIAPAELVAEAGSDVKVSSTDPGVVVRTPTVQLQFDDELDFYRAIVRVEGRNLDAAGQVEARIGEIAATAQVKVTRKEEGPEFTIELSQEDMGLFRCVIESKVSADGRTMQVVKVAARHPAIQPYLGNTLEGQNSPIVRAMIAEAVADAAARLVSSKLYYSRRNTEGFDVDRFYREHYRRVAKFLPAFQKHLVGDPDAARSGKVLPPSPVLLPAAEA